MHSKRRFKIGICSVLLVELESFRNHKGYNVILPKILDTIDVLRKWEFFLFFFIHHIFETTILGLLFLRKLALHGE